MKNSPENIEYETCIMCGELTKIPISLPIGCRKNYVVGLGQLCEKCQNKLDREVRNNIDSYLYKPQKHFEPDKSKNKKSQKTFK